MVFCVIFLYRQIFQKRNWNCQKNLTKFFETNIDLNLLMKANIILILLVSILGSCQQEKKRKEAEKIIKEWVGKTILFPDNVKCFSISKDSICPDPMTKSYKVLVYTDSIGCTSCKLQLFRWHELISETDSVMSGQLKFLFYFQPKNEEEMVFLFRRNRFMHPSYLDTHNQINTLNHLPHNPAYQCFLLDNDNTVLLVGNPSLNPEVWNLYKKVVLGDDFSKPKEKVKSTEVFIEHPVLELSGLKKDKVTQKEFALKNSGNSPLIINNIITSCVCMVPEWDKSPVAPGKTTIIEVVIKPEETGYFHKIIDVFCNTKSSPVKLTVKGEVNE